MSVDVGAKGIEELEKIPLSYNNDNSDASALRLISALFPEWELSDGKIDFVRFTDGITNTLLKAMKRRPGYSEEQIDDDAVLIRAYGKGTEILIDRERETANHLSLALNNLAPPLLARFQNGLIYRFVPGYVCTYKDFAQDKVWKGVARRLGEWHAVMPVTYTGHALDDKKTNGVNGADHDHSSTNSIPSLEEIKGIAWDKSVPNVWTVLQRWILALSTDTIEERSRKAVLLKEFMRTVKELGNAPGLGKDGLVFGHGDLLSANCIIQPSLKGTSDAETISFIDYEYSIPCPAAFDIANHFAEWAGLDCDYGNLPTRSTRHCFLRQYMASYMNHLPDTMPYQAPLEAEVEQLFAAVDKFRGIPGLYWGVWALIQATISQIDFDYAKYAEVRLAEYWGWRGSNGLHLGLREKRWAQD